MPLPESVTEHLWKEPVKTPGWFSQLLIFSLSVFLISLVAYFGLVFGYRPYLNSRLQKLNDQIESLSRQVPVEEQNKVIDFYSQLANIKSLLRNHILVSPVFDWLEKNTEPNVYYQVFNWSPTSKKLSLEGIAKTADDFNKQIAAFESNQSVANLNVGNFSVDANSGLWRFSLSFTFNQQP